jgi:hypothetical protein
MKLMHVVSKIDLKEVMRYNDLTVSIANYIHLLDTFLQHKMLMKGNTHTATPISTQLIMQMLTLGN